MPASFSKQAMCRIGQNLLDYAPSLCAKRGGLHVPADRQRDVLETLGFAVDVKGDDAFHVSVPSFRPDIDRKEDLVEEVLRIVGYNEIPEADFTRPANMPASVISDEQRKRLAVHRAGGPRPQRSGDVQLYQQQVRPAFGWDATNQGNLRVANPISEELDVMRPSLRQTRWKQQRETHRGLPRYCAV